MFRTVRKHFLWLLYSKVLKLFLAMAVRSTPRLTAITLDPEFVCVGCACCNPLGSRLSTLCRRRRWFLWALSAMVREFLLSLKWEVFCITLVRSRPHSVPVAFINNVLPSQHELVSYDSSSARIIEILRVLPLLALTTRPTLDSLCHRETAKFGLG